jgi:hypothetical protein
MLTALNIITGIAWYLAQYESKKATVRKQIEYSGGELSDMVRQ